MRVLNAHRCGLDPVLAGTAVLCDRTTKWGNPVRIRPGVSRAQAVWEHRVWLPHQGRLLACLNELEGMDLLCWCWPKPCHCENLRDAVEGRLV